MFKVRKVAIPGLVAVVALQGLQASASATATSTADLVSGVVVAVAGAPAAGSTVSVDAWPNGASLEALPRGAKVKLFHLGTAVTDASGHFVLRNSLATVPASYVEPNGVVNYDATAVTASGDQQSISATAAVPGTAAAQSGNVAVADVRGADLLFDMRSRAVSVRFGGNSAKSYAQTPVAGPAAQDLAPTMQPDAGVPTPGCTTWSKYTEYYRQNEVFLDLYDYGSAIVNLTVGTSHTLGVGFSSGGSWGGYGTATLSSNTAAGAVAEYWGNQQLSNEVNYINYVRSCPQKGGRSLTEHMVRPATVAFLLTGALNISSRAWSASDCFAYTSTHAGQVHSKTVGSNLEFDAGVNLSFVQLSAQVSFSKSTTASWIIPKAGEELCGSTSDGFASAPFAGGEAIPVGACATPLGAEQPATIPGC